MIGEHHDATTLIGREADGGREITGRSVMPQDLLTLMGRPVPPKTNPCFAVFSVRLLGEAQGIRHPVGRLGRGVRFEERKLVAYRGVQSASSGKCRETPAGRRFSACGEYIGGPLEEFVRL